MRRAAAVLFGILAALLLLEGTLQALSYVMLRRERDAQRPPDSIQTFSGRRVLCVGDSYTYGIGSSDREASYPARLEEHLKTAGDGDPWIVVNEGWPSRNSQELTEMLPHLLQEYDPDWVVVLIGINDRWSDARPREMPASPAADPRAWTWKWRTKRLFDIAWANLRGTREKAAPPQGPVRDSVPSPAADAPVAVAVPDSVAMPDSSDSLSVLRQHLRQVLESDTSKAATQFQRKEVYAMAQEARRIGSEELAIDVVEAYGRLRMHTFAVQEGLDALKRHGESARLARALVHPLQRTQKTEDALRFAERSVQLDSLDAENWRVLAAARFQIPDLPGGLRALLEFQKRGGDDAVLTRQIRGRNLAAAISTEELESAIRGAGMPEEKAAKVRLLFREMAQPTEHEIALQSHLSRMAALIREHGAKPLFLNYRLLGVARSLRSESMHRRDLRARGIPFLDLRSLLEREVQVRPGEELFIPDGHCTDQGYDLVAKAVAAELRKLDPGPSS